MMAEPLSPLTQEASVPIGRRAAARLRLAIPARFVSIHSTQNCILLDISRTGARLALASPLAEHQSGIVTFAQFELFGSIVRADHGADHGADGGANALAFDDPITEAYVLDVRRFAEGFELHERHALRDLVRRWVAGEP
jgi:hypothetical protein